MGLLNDWTKRWLVRLTGKAAEPGSVFITLDDKTDRLELLIFAEEAERYARFIKEEQLVFIQAAVSPDKYKDRKSVV